MINLYLDDTRKCPENFILAKTFEEAIFILENYKVNILSLDHDLGLDKNGNLRKTGYDLVKYICENNILVNEIYLHTANPIGRENMYHTLLSAQRRGFINKSIKIYPYPYIRWQSKKFTKEGLIIKL